MNQKVNVPIPTVDEAHQMLFEEIKARLPAYKELESLDALMESDDEIKNLIIRLDRLEHDLKPRIMDDPTVTLNSKRDFLRLLHNVFATPAERYDIKMQILLSYFRIYANSAFNPVRMGQHIPALTTSASEHLFVTTMLAFLPSVADYSRRKARLQKLNATRILSVIESDEARKLFMAFFGLS